MIRSIGYRLKAVKNSHWRLATSAGQKDGIVGRHSSQVSSCCSSFHTMNSYQRVKFEQALSEVSNKTFCNIRDYLLKQQTRMESSSSDGRDVEEESVMDLLKRVDFKRLSQEYAIEPRATYHEYSHNGNLMRLSRKPDDSVRSSAVVALFVEKCEDGRKVPYLVLLQKTPAKKNTNYQHAGQVSFPGGVFDANSDKSLLDTALRETFEEIGLNNVEIINQSLPSTTTGARNFNVQPFIGKLVGCEESHIPYNLQLDEIAHVFEVKLLDLISNPNISTFEPLGKTEMAPTSSHYGPVYHLKNIHSITHNQLIPHVPLWGYTATVVTHILDGLNFELSK